MRFFKVLLLGAAVSVVNVGCAHLTPTEQQLIDCGAPAVQNQIMAPGGLLGKVTALLSGGQVNWQSNLDQLLVDAGPAVVCAVQVAVKALEGGGPAGAAAAVTVPLVHGNMWLASEGHYKLVK